MKILQPINLSNIPSRIRLIVGFFILATAALSVVAEPLAASQCGGIQTAILKCDAKGEVGESNAGGLWEILLTGVRILTAGIGIAAVAGLAYGAFLYTSAGGSSAQISQAKDTIRNVIIGIIMFAGMYSFLEYIVPGGIFNRTYDFGTIQPKPPADDNRNNGSGSNGGVNKNKKTTIRIGVYNAASVTTADGLEVGKLNRGMAQMRAQDADIVTLQELSVRQTSELRDSSVWVIYRSDMGGDRGLGIAYRKDRFTQISSGSVSIPHPDRAQKQPILTLERKRDKARITVISVHLKAVVGNVPQYNEYQQKQQKVLRDKVLDISKSGDTVIAAGDYNWFFNDRAGWMSPFIHRGDRVMRVFGSPDQKFSEFKKHVDKSITDHALISINVETDWYGK